MESFLAEVVADVLATYDDIQNIKFILPGKRAGNFLKNEFIKQNTITGFAPEFVSIESFIESISGLKYANTIQLLFFLYETYLEVTTEDQDSFYKFSNWATTLLQDFNEVDRHIVAPETIFPYLASVKELNHWSLEPEQTDLQKQYIAFWNSLGDYYYNFKERLQNKGVGYQGMVYREALENLELYLQHNSQIKHIFVGFNALNKAEKTIVQELLESGNTSVYWDIDAHFLDNNHDAGLFINQHLKSWKYYNTHEPKWINNTFTTTKNIHLIGVPKSVGQTKYTGKLLSELDNNSGTLKNTVVVLGDESLLIPMVNEIPEGITQVNITMGMPLHSIPLSNFFKSFFELYLQSKSFWYYKELLQVLTHPIGRLLLDAQGNNLIEFINTKNKIQLSPAEVATFLNNEASIFTDPSKITAEQFLNNCQEIIYLLKQKYESDNNPNTLELEYLYKFHELFNQLQGYVGSHNFITDIKTLFGLFKEVLSSETLDFQGEPLEGLQLMGMLESRNLDFETVIITSVNEGILPSGKSNNSFIPHDIKVHLDLPTYKEKDAVYTYHFYRLLQRAKNVYLLYNTEIADALKGSEKSRFILQLAHQNIENHNITHTIAAPDIVNKPQDITITKDAELVKQLYVIAAKGFSPSSLTNYVRNPIDFYKQTVLGIADPEEVEETIAANTLGTILHNTLENLYKPLENHILDTEKVTAFSKTFETELQRQFITEYKGAYFSQGKNLLIYHVAKTYLRRFFEKELELVSNNTVRIITIEGNYKIPLTIPGLNTPIILKGKVDRVDEINGKLRIVDYKSGKVESKHVEIVDWVELREDYTYSKAFQVLAYAYMRYQNTPFTEAEAGIISFKNLQAGFLNFCIKDKRAPRAVKDTSITKETLALFEEQLHALIREIVNPEIPFTEKEV